MVMESGKKSRLTSLATPSAIHTMDNMLMIKSMDMELSSGNLETSTSEIMMEMKDKDTV